MAVGQQSQRLYSGVRMCVCRELLISRLLLKYLSTQRGRNLIYFTDVCNRPFPNGHSCSFGCDGYVKALAAGQQADGLTLDSGVGVGIFINWYRYYPSTNPSPPPGSEIPSGAQLE